jgi:hypothetical protein
MCDNNVRVSEYSGTVPRGASGLVDTLDEAQIRVIMRYRLAIARAAQPDSLGWWDDQSLSRGADGLLRRLFPRSAPLAGSRLALLAATAWHQRMLEAHGACEHLFFLGEEVELLLDQRLDELGLAPDVEPTPDAAGLRARLLEIGPSPGEVASGGEGRTFALPVSVADRGAAERAAVLAWAYLAGKQSQPVAPFIPSRSSA